MNRRRTRALSVWAAAALALAGTLGTASAALADDVYNNLDTSIDATAESMALDLGGQNGTTTFYVAPTDDDGKNGCNLTGQTTLTVKVESSGPAVATVGFGSDGNSPTATFTSCGDQKAVTIRPVGAGTATISLSETGNTTGRSFNFAPATFTVTVSARNTAPQVSVTNVTQGASYEKGSVPTAMCAVTDTEDGAVTPFAATLSDDLDNDGLGSQTATCSYTDRGPGPLTQTVSATYSIIDGSAPVVGYTLSPAKPDGLDGWYRGSVTLDWDVAETQSPLSLQTTGCEDQQVLADQHATTYSCTATSSGGTTGPVEVSIKRDGNGPVVTYDGIAPGALEGNDGWYRSPVTATFKASDTFSGVAGADEATVTSTGDGDAVSLASPAFSDKAGNTTGAGAANSPEFKIDTVAPEVLEGAVTSGDLGNDHWYTSEVTASFEASDDTSGVEGTNPKTVSTGTAQGTVTLDSPAFSDVAGNTTPSGNKKVTVKVDTVAPEVGEGVVTSGDLGDNGWYTSEVTASFTATDGTSGVAGDKTRTASTGTTQGEVTLDSPAFSDVAGNTTEAGTKKKTVKVDSVAPAVELTGGPAEGAKHPYGSVPAEPTCDATDETSKVASCVVSGYGTGVGTHTVTATATDHAGNTSTASRTYTVDAWGLKGFYQPVDMGGVINKVKGGSTVPLKFEVFAGSTELTDVSAVKSFGAASITCSSTAPVDALEITTTGGTSLRYDTSGGQFVQNWKTPTALGCYGVTMTTQDGSKLTAKFQVTK